MSSLSPKVLAQRLFRILVRAKFFKLEYNFPELEGQSLLLHKKKREVDLKILNKVAHMLRLPYEVVALRVGPTRKLRERELAVVPLTEFETAEAILQYAEQRLYVRQPRSMRLRISQENVRGGKE